MKRFTRVVASILFIPAAGIFLFGCPKKVAKKDPATQPRVSESVVDTRPGGPGAGEPGAGARQPVGQTEEQRMAQLLASRGEDIPIKDAPNIEFMEPAGEDRAVFTPVYFDYDKSNIRPEYQPVLEGIGAWMTRQANRQLLVEGHCDERGTDEYNLALGERRALAVRRYLVALGVPAERLHTISYGEEKPADPGHDERSWSKNRRAGFMISAQ